MMLSEFRNPLNKIQAKFKNVEKKNLQSNLILKNKNFLFKKSLPKTIKTKLHFH